MVKKNADGEPLENAKYYGLKIQAMTKTLTASAALELCFTQTADMQDPSPFIAPLQRKQISLFTSVSFHSLFSPYGLRQTASGKCFPYPDCLACASHFQAGMTQITTERMH